MSRPPVRSGKSGRSIYSRRPRFESLETRELLATFVVSSAADSGEGSLRSAILQTNSNTSNNGPDLIVFNLPGSDRTINLASSLPTITHQVSIDGQSQPGYETNPLVVLNGSGAGAGANGLSFTSSGNVVRGLVIQGFQSNSSQGGVGISLGGNGGNLIQNNYLGLDLSGTAAAPNRVGISISSPNNIIGGAGLKLGNFIAGNSGVGTAFGAGVELDGATARGNALQGNYIGLGADGITPVPNSYGVSFGSSAGAGLPSASNTIGGTAIEAGNFISGNNNDGIALNGSSSNLIIGNFIGLDGDGNAAGNQGNGISQVVTTGSTAPITLNNLLGVDFAGAGNRIWYSGKAGVLVNNTSGGTVVGTNIQGNSFTGNAGPAIDLGGDGQSPGYLFVTSASRNTNGQLTLNGVYHGSPNSTYFVNLFGNDSADPSGYGQGDLFLSTVKVTTDVLGNATFSQLYNGVSQSIFAATVTDSAGTTSEFSPTYPLAASVPSTDLTMNLTGPTTSVSPGSSVTLTATITNSGKSAANNVLFDDLLPDEILYQSGTASNGVTVSNNSQSTGGLVSANLGTIAAGATVTVTIVGTAIQSGTLTNAAAVFSSTFDTNYTDNQAVQQLTVLPPTPVSADLGITQTSFSPFGGKVVGQNLVYTITVMNNGPNAATGVTVTDFIPGGQQYVDASSSQGTSSYNNGLLTTNLGSLPIGASATVTVLLKLAQAGTATNVANVAGAQLDTNTSNNSSSLVDSIAASTSAATQPLAISQVSSVSSGTIGQPQTITLTVTNPNTVAAPGVILTETPPSNASSLRAAVSQGTLSTFNGSFVASFGSIAAGGTATLTVTLTPTTNAGLTSTAAVVASGVPGAVVTFSTQVFPVGGVGIGPSVTAITAPGTGSSINRLSIRFGSALNRSTAIRATNYRLFALGASGTGSQRIPVRSAAYNASTQTVTITLGRSVPLAQVFRLLVVGASSTGIRDTAGNRLNGSNGAGSNYVATFSGTSLIRA